MTRINLVKVEDLADQHLFAEWREIKMIPAKVRKLWEQDTQEEFISLRLPPNGAKYTLSTGHVRFFYNKMFFLHDRYIQLTDELHKRNYNIAETYPSMIFIHNMNTFSLGEWTPSKEEIQINIDRITERLNQRPNWYRYYGEIKSPEFFIERYNHQLTVDTLVGD